MRRLAFLFAAVFCLALILGADCCPKQQPSVLYIAFGDSATDSDAPIKYPWYIKEWLGLDDDELANEGESGQTLAEGYPRLVDMLDCDTYPNAEVVLFLMGGNDLIDWVQETDPNLTISPDSALYPYEDELNAKLAEIQNYLYNSMLEIRGHGMEPIVATYYQVMPFVSPCSLTPLGFFTLRQAEIVNDYVDRLNERIELVADVLGIAVADIASSGALYGNANNWLNCNHANENGNEIIATFFFEQIVAIGGPTELEAMYFEIE